MAGSELSIRVNIDSQPITDRLRRLAASARDAQPAMMEIAEFLHERTRDHFDNEQDPDGNPWAPLAESSQGAKRRKGVPVDQILHGQSLHLRDTIFPFWSNNEAGVSTGLGSEAYAATHQFGADKRKIPARPFLGLSAEDENEIVDILNQFLTGGL
ncbi:phage virion morphogenesis protein [Neptunomonas antarctica]|uniref:Phage virion morphogenesis (Putative tail completion) protein n=1 Tax=Neptunomonas antarctica TaxID=619304 RepID=A0A1N7MPS3_9GAMM|nr:phage virion morphogenesis protein [Neptunomonas antarctica]SIS87998.1 phage virion morphogenesis (putative tail completion) protein [Neptunomonas antarctica]